MSESAVLRTSERRPVRDASDGDRRGASRSSRRGHARMGPGVKKFNYLHHGGIQGRPSCALIIAHEPDPRRAVAHARVGEARQPATNQHSQRQRKLTHRRGVPRAHTLESLSNRFSGCSATTTTETTTCHTCTMAAQRCGERRASPHRIRATSAERGAAEDDLDGRPASSRK